ncbi:hypothetical protein Drorol1_Dr00010327 [Drosera rotundifolia]
MEMDVKFNEAEMDFARDLDLPNGRRSHAYRKKIRCPTASVCSIVEDRVFREICGGDCGLMLRDDSFVLFMRAGLLKERLMDHRNRVVWLQGKKYVLGLGGKNGVSNCLGIKIVNLELWSLSVRTGVLIAGIVDEDGKTIMEKGLSAATSLHLCRRRWLSPGSPRKAIAGFTPVQAQPRASPSGTTWIIAWLRNWLVLGVVLRVVFVWVLLDSCGVELVVVSSTRVAGGGGLQRRL